MNQESRDPWHFKSVSSLIPSLSPRGWFQISHSSLKPSRSLAALVFHSFLGLEHRKSGAFVSLRGKSGKKGRGDSVH